MNNFSKKKWNINVPITYNNPMYARKTRNNLNNLSNSEKQFLANTNNLTVSERKEILRKRRKNLKNKRARQLMRSLNTYKSSEIVSYKQPNLAVNSSMEYINNPLYTTTVKNRNNNLNKLSNGEKQFLENTNNLTVNQRKQIIRKRRENIKNKRGRQLMRSLNTYRAV